MTTRNELGQNAKWNLPRKIHEMDKGAEESNTGGRGIEISFEDIDNRRNAVPEEIAIEKDTPRARPYAVFVESACRHGGWWVTHK